MIDHVACPSFDAAATHRFYADVLGAHLKSAFTGDSAEWNARAVTVRRFRDGDARPLCEIFFRT